MATQDGRRPGHGDRAARRTRPAGVGQIEEKALPNLGGKGDEWDFTGFSIGFGAETTSSGAAGRCTAGGILDRRRAGDGHCSSGELETAGELRFGPVGVSIEGNVELTLTEDDARLEGEFCGEVDLALFKAKGCVHITLGGAAAGDRRRPARRRCEPQRSARPSRHHSRSVQQVAPAQHTPPGSCRPTVHFSKRVVVDLEGDSFRPTPAGGGAPIGAARRWTKFLTGSCRGAARRRRRRRRGKRPNGQATGGSPPAGRRSPPKRDAVVRARSLGPRPPGLGLARRARALSDGERRAGIRPRSSSACAIRCPDRTRHCVYGADGERLEADQVRFAAAPTGTAVAVGHGARRHGDARHAARCGAHVGRAARLPLRTRAAAAHRRHGRRRTGTRWRASGNCLGTPTTSVSRSRSVSTGRSRPRSTTWSSSSPSLPPPTTGEVELCTDFEEWERRVAAPGCGSTSPSASPVTPARSRGPTRCRSRTRS